MSTISGTIYERVFFKRSLKWSLIILTVKRILAQRGADARIERDNLALVIEGGKIAALSSWNESTRPEAGDLDLRDCLLAPGFIDIHVHGGAGRYLMEGTEEAQNIVSAHLATHGVTGFLPTSVTGPWELEAKVLELAHLAMNSVDNGQDGAAILGCHLEGPFINPKKKGAQPEQHICKPSVEALMKRVGTHFEALKIVTIAPEMEGALEVIKFLTANGVIASLGHTNATYEQVGAAIDAGARHVTHCFNAMRPMEGREPGVVGAAFERAELKAELIWDNIHVHPASCRALIAAKGAESVILISDGIPAAGMGENYRFTLGDLPIRIENGSARLPDGTLAGSLLTLDSAYANATPYTLSQRSSMTSYNAANALGLGHRKGLIAPGYDADLVLLAPDGSVRATIVGGRTVYESKGATS